jgi:hypothetical protein
MCPLLKSHQLVMLSQVLTLLPLLAMLLCYCPAGWLTAPGSCTWTAALMYVQQGTSRAVSFVALGGQLCVSQL